MTDASEISGDEIIDQAPDAIIFAGVDGAIRRWNPAAERIFGISSADAVGANLDIIIPEKFREAHWAGFERAVASGTTKYAGQALPTRALRGDGEEFYVELSFSVIKDAQGVVHGALAHARDITERFNRDRETRRQIRDLEQQLAEYQAGDGAASPSDA